MKMKEMIPFKNFGRLKLTLTIAMLGILTDTIMTNLMLNSNSGFYESNQILHPEIGIPVMVLNYVVSDLHMPREIYCDNVFYALAVLTWAGPIQNLLVLLNVTPGISPCYVIPFILIASFVVIHFRVNRENGF